MEKQLTGSEQQYQRMIQTPIPKLVSSLAIPTTVGMLITVIYNTADTYFVSQINKSAAAAVGAVYAVMSIIQAIGFGLGMGSGSLISRKLGAKEDQAAHTYASSAFFAAILCGALISVFGLLFLEPMLKLLGCSETMMPHAIPYAKFVLIAAPISCSTFVLNNTLRSQGRSMQATIGMSIGGILNVILDPIFIFGLNMSTGGAALATAISQSVNFCVLLCFFLAGKSIVSVHPKHVSRKFADYKAIVTTGLPTICRQGLGSVAAAVLNIQAIAFGGDAAGAAITIFQQGLHSGTKPSDGSGTRLPAGCRLQLRRRQQTSCLGGIHLLHQSRYSDVHLLCRCHRCFCRADHVVVLQRCGGGKDRHSDPLPEQRHSPLPGLQHLCESAVSVSWFQGTGHLPGKLPSGHFLPACGFAAAAGNWLSGCAGGAARW